VRYSESQAPNDVRYNIITKVPEGLKRKYSRSFIRPYIEDSTSTEQTQPHRKRMRLAASKTPVHPSMARILIAGQ